MGKLIEFGRMFLSYGLLMLIIAVVAGVAVWRYIHYQKVEIEIARFDFMMRVMKEEQNDME